MRTVSLLFVGVLLLSACTKKQSTPTQNPTPTPNPIPQIGKCMLTQMTLTIEATEIFDLNSDNIAFYYDNNYVDSAHHVKNQLGYKYTYQNNLLSNIKEYKAGSLQLALNIKYNNNNLSEITYLDATGSVLRTIKFNYNNNGQIVQKTTVQPSGSHSLTYIYNGNLLSKVEYKDVDGNNHSYSYTYSNDDNKLVIDNVTARYLLNLNGEDEAQTLCDGLLNNGKLITSLKRDNNVYNFTYQLNAKGYPEKVTCNGKIIMENQFNCK